MPKEPWEMTRDELVAAAVGGRIGPYERNDIEDLDASSEAATRGKINAVLSGSKPAAEVAYSQEEADQLFSQYARQGLKISQYSSGQEVWVAYTNKAAFEQLEQVSRQRHSAKGSAAMGRALGYSEADIAAFYAADNFELYNKAVSEHRRRRPLHMKEGGIVPGSGSGDTVPAMLEPGELVIPKKDVDALRSKLAANQTVLNPKADLDPIVVQKGAKARNYTKRYLDRIDRAGQELLGEAYSAENIARIVGAPPGSTVKYYLDAIGELKVDVKHPDIEEMKRTIGVTMRPGPVPIPEDELTPGQIASQATGKWMRWEDQPYPYIHNDLLIVKDKAQGKGLGLDIFSHQVKAAQEMGIKEINTYAAGQGGPTAFIGYKTWPKMGYDQPINERTYWPAMIQKIKSAFPNAETVQDILDSSTTMPDFDESGKIVGSKQISGQEWWDKNGAGMLHATFDLTPGSRSQKKLAAYQAAKGYVPRYHEGGIVPGQGEVPAVLEGGELVVPKKAVDAAKHRRELPDFSDFIGEAFSDVSFSQLGSSGAESLLGGRSGLRDGSGEGMESRALCAKIDALIRTIETLVKALEQKNPGVAIKGDTAAPNPKAVFDMLNAAIKDSGPKKNLPDSSDSMVQSLRLMGTMTGAIAGAM